MAVTPVSLLTLSSAEQDLVTRMEAEIDAELRSKYVANKPVYVRAGVLRDLFSANERVLEAVIDLYTSAGWAVKKYNSDDGDWLSFAG